MRNLLSAKTVLWFCRRLAAASQVLSLLSSRLDEWRYRRIDDSCGCKNCEERRAKGHQGPRRFF